MEFEPEAVIRMMVAKKNIVCTPYRVNCNPHQTFLYTVEVQEILKKILDNLAEGLVEIEAGPTGLMLIDRAVFEKIIRKIILNFPSIIKTLVSTLRK